MPGMHTVLLRTWDYPVIQGISQELIKSRELKCSKSNRIILYEKYIHFLKSMKFIYSDSDSSFLRAR